MSSSSRSGLVPAQRVPGSVPDSDIQLDSSDDDDVVTSDRDLLSVRTHLKLTRVLVTNLKYNQTKRA